MRYCCNAIKSKCKSQCAYGVTVTSISLSELGNMATDNGYIHGEASPLGAIFITSGLFVLANVRFAHKLYSFILKSKFTSLPIRKQQMATTYTNKAICYGVALIFGCLSNQIQTLFHRIITNTPKLESIAASFNKSSWGLFIF
ncbi:hypothetical protein BKA69DRAFT_1058063 [Paraphysoderma sedebokerense]|nr:hypothetical protein BKA69DRAFT_1058063 [Paraphysoderma sedebokerense]